MIDLNLAGVGLGELQPFTGVGVVQGAREHHAVSGAGLELDFGHRQCQHVVTGSTPVVPARSVVVVRPRRSEHAPFTALASALVPTRIGSCGDDGHPIQQRFDLGAGGAARSRGWGSQSRYVGPVTGFERRHDDRGDHQRRRYPQLLHTRPIVKLRSCRLSYLATAVCRTVPTPPETVGCQRTSMTTLPSACPFSTSARASPARSSGNV